MQEVTLSQEAIDFLKGKNKDTICVELVVSGSS